MNKYEALDKFYEFDHKITQKAKKVSHKIERKTGRGIESQIWIFLIVFFTLLITSEGLELSMTGLTSTDDIFLLTSFLITYEITPYLLYVIHRHIDKENTSHFEWRQASGYSAWRHVLLGVIVILSGVILRNEITSTHIMSGIFFSGIAYFDFVRRTIRPPKKRDKKEQSSVALERLLERCREWLGQRQPLPTS